MAEDIRALSKYNELTGGKGLSILLEKWVKIEKDFLETCGQMKVDNEKTPPKLSDYFDGVDDGFIEYIKKEFQGRKGRSVATIILALEKCEVLKYDNLSVFFKVLASEAKVEGTRQAVQKALPPPHFELTDNSNFPTKKEVDIWVNRIKNHL